MEKYAINIRIGNDLVAISRPGKKKRETPIAAELSSWSVVVREGKEKLVMEIVLPTNSELKDSLRHIKRSADYEKKEFRKLLVEILNLSLFCWKTETYKTGIELAEESGLWTVTSDMKKGTFRAQTLDRYTRLRTLPKHPKIGTVFDTASFVLEKCSGHETEITAELKVRVRQAERMLKYA